MVPAGEGKGSEMLTRTRVAWRSGRPLAGGPGAIRSVLIGRPSGFVRFILAHHPAGGQLARATS